MEQLILAPGRILVETVEEREVQRKSGIIVPQGAITSLLRCKVLKVGPGLNEREMEIKPGDHIFFKKGMEMKIKYQDETYWLLDWNQYLMYEKAI